MWCWGRKTASLYKYIMLQADNERAWEFSEYKATHISRVQIWIANGFPFVDVYDYNTTGKQCVGFSLMQKWRIHRKLKKLKQKIEKADKLNSLKKTLNGFDSKEEMYLAKMVEGTLTGGRAK